MELLKAVQVNEVLTLLKTETKEGRVAIPVSSTVSIIRMNNELEANPDVKSYLELAEEAKGKYQEEVDVYNKAIQEYINEEGGLADEEDLPKVQTLRKVLDDKEIELFSFQKDFTDVEVEFTVHKLGDKSLDCLTLQPDFVEFLMEIEMI